MKAKNFLSFFLTFLMCVAFLPLSAYIKPDAEAEEKKITYTFMDSNPYDTPDESENAEIPIRKWYIYYTIDSNGEYTGNGNMYYVTKASEKIRLTSYQITVGCILNNGVFPENWVLYACNDYDETSKSGTWTELDRVTDGTTKNGLDHMETYTFDVDTNDAYQYYKLEVLKIYGSNNHSMYISSINFIYDPEIKVTCLTGTENTSKPAENYDKLMDESIDTKWCTACNDDVSPYIIFKTSTEAVLKGYYLFTGNDNKTATGRNPKRWRIYGCNDYDESSGTGSWRTFESRIDNTVMKDYNKTPYYFDMGSNQNSYKYYKLEILETQGANLVQLSELELLFKDDYTGAVTFNENGGDTHAYPKKIKAGEALPEINPIKEGYSFLGWYTKKGDNNDWGDKVESTEGCAYKTFYARWVKYDSDITFNTVGGYLSDRSSYLFDGNTSTKWIVGNYKDGVYTVGDFYRYPNVIIEASDIVLLNGYNFTTGNDNSENNGRNPKSWKIYGTDYYEAISSNGMITIKSGKWEELISVTNDTQMRDEDSKTYFYSVDNKGKAYKYYKLEISGNQGADSMQLSELRLFTSRGDYVKFDKNGGDVDSVAKLIEKGRGLPETPPERSGYTFAGWYTKDGTDDDWGEAFTNSSASHSVSTAYAKWEEIIIDPNPVGYEGITTDEGYGYENLFDKNTDTKWVVSGYNSETGKRKTADNKTDNPYFIVKYSNPVRVTGFTLTAADDAEEHQGSLPNSWEVYGSNDMDAGWTKIDDSLNKMDRTTDDVNKKKYTSAVTHFQGNSERIGKINKDSYLYYKFVIVQNTYKESQKAYSETLRISEFEFWVDTEYTITYILNGGKLAGFSDVFTKTYLGGAISTPKFSGMTFDGWFTKDGTNGDWGEEFTRYSAVFSDTTIYAKYSSSHKHCEKGDSQCEDEPHYYALWDGSEEINYVDGNAYIALTKDVTLEEGLELSGNLSLCLNGYSLTCSDTENPIIKSNSYTLNICDCSEAKTGKIGMRSADIAAIALYDNAELNLYGGSITENISSAKSGGGIYAENSVVNMYGGTVSDNEVTTDGGGIFVTGSAGKLNIYGGVIKENQATFGGGIYLAGSSVGSITGGTISNNAASTRGGGAYVYCSELSVLGGEIVSNSAKNGAGIGVKGSNSVLNYNGGSVKKNTATEYGGGIYGDENSEVTVNGGEISENTAGFDGGGAYFGGTSFAVGEKAKIFGNKANNLYIPSGKLINASQLSDGAKVGISIESDSVGAFSNATSANTNCYFSDNSDFDIYKINGALAIACVLTLDYGGGEIRKHYYDYNSSVNLENLSDELPLKPNYSFLGWFNEDDEKVTSLTMNKSYGLNAKWVNKAENSLTLTKDTAYVTLEAEALNNTVVCLCAYKGDMLSDIVELTLSPATEGEEIIYQTFSVENTGLNTKGSDMIKLFMWDTDMNPLCKSVSCKYYNPIVNKLSLTYNNGNIEITVQKESAKNANLYICSYKNDMLLDINVTENISSGTFYILKNDPFNSFNTQDADRIAVFMWDDDMNALCECAAADLWY